MELAHLPVNAFTAMWANAHRKDETTQTFSPSDFAFRQHPQQQVSEYDRLEAQFLSWQSKSVKPKILPKEQADEEVKRTQRKWKKR